MSTSTKPNVDDFTVPEKILLAADAALDAVAVFDTQANAGSEDDPQAAVGFIPTEWYPSALAMRGDELLIANLRYRFEDDPDQHEPAQLKPPAPRRLAGDLLSKTSRILFISRN